MQGLAPCKGGKGIGGVLGTVLLDVQLAELLMRAEFVGAAHIGGDVGRDRIGTAQIGQADAGDAQRVFDQLAVGARQVLQLLERRIAAAGDLQIEHAEE